MWFLWLAVGMGKCDILDAELLGVQKPVERIGVIGCTLGLRRRGT